MQGIFLLLLGTLVWVNVAAISDGLHDEISRFLGVECEPKGFIVSLSFNLTKHRLSMTRSIAETLSGAMLQVGNYEECQSEKNLKKAEHIAKFGYTACGARAEKKNYGTHYMAEIVVNLDTTQRPSHVNVYMFSVSCTVLDSELKKTRFEVTRRGVALDTAEMKAINMPVNSLLSMQIKPTLSSVARGLQEIYTYPAKCTVSSISDKAARVVVLDKGCPRYSGKFLLSSIYQMDSLLYTATGTEIFINTFNEVLPPTKPDEDGRFLNLNISCDVFFCTSNQKHRILGVPLCPSATPCSGSSRVQPLLQVGGAVQLHSAHLPLPVRVDLERDGGIPRERTPIRQPQTNFPKEICEPPPPQGPSYPLLFALLFIGIVVGFGGGLCIFRFVPLFHYFLGNRLSSTVVSQADHVPQPYHKLEPTPRLLSDQPTVS